MGGIIDTARACARTRRFRPAPAAAPTTSPPAPLGTAIRARVARVIGGGPLEAAIAGELALRTAHLESLAYTDALTGIANRRAGLAALSASLEKDGSTGFLMLDLDDFKHVNDTFGHDAGDDVLRAVAQAASKVADEHSGTAMRLGGEEFAVVLPGRDAGSARAVGEALAARIRSTHVTDPAGNPIRLSASVGATASHGSAGGTEDALASIMRAADEGMYQAKASGKDRVVDVPPSLGR